MNRHFYYLTIVLCWLMSLQTGVAQSFLKFYDMPPNLNPEVQSVLVYPNGDYGVGLRHASNTVGLLRTDANGQQLGFNTQQMPENAAHFRELNGSVVTAALLADSLVVWERNPAQDMVWRTAIKLAPSVVFSPPFGVTENEAGEIFVTGYYYLGTSSHFQYFTVKFDPDGVFLWKNTVTTNDYQGPHGVSPDGAGGCLSGWPIIDTMLPSSVPYYHLLTRYLPDGSVAWHSKTLPNLGLNATSYGINDAGQSLVIQADDFQSNDTTWMLLLGPAGDTVWHNYLNNVPAVCQLVGRLVLPIENAGFYVLGTNYLDNLNQLNATVAKVNIDGSIAWTRSFPNLVLGQIKFTAGQVLSDGSLVAAGWADANRIAIIKITPDGDLDSYQNVIEGHVLLDDNDNCIAENGEPPVQNWIVTVQGPDFSLFTVTDANGFYQVPFIDTGAYKIYMTPPSYIWQSCPDTAMVVFPGGAQATTDTVDFAVQTPVDCPVLQVEIAAANFRRCTDFSASVQVCNLGNVTAIPAEIRIVPDPAITLSGFSYPFTTDGDTLVITVDSLPPLECLTVQMTVFIDCNTPLGQTLCMEATVRPDEICVPPSSAWMGANIEVDGSCDGDSVRLRIRNTGFGPTSQPVDYVIIDDHVITWQDATHLLAGEIIEEVVPANGATWRLTATQEPGHPMGNQDPTVAVEGCTVTGGFTTGMFNLFGNHNGNNFGDVFCKEVIGSYDPNDKTGFPYGVDEPHCMEAGQEMEYLIRFQNTGTDTAFHVEIRDTLSHWLNPATIRAGASSHPYTWNLSGDGILSIVFDDIMLPDSNVNEPASNGFVTFKILQRTGNPEGVVVYNQAAIYFDENEPVLTNTTYHTICKNFLEVDIVNVDAPVVGKWQVQISPNPASEFVRIHLPENSLQNGVVVLRDALGREVRRMRFNGTTAGMQREGLVAGVYFLEILENGVRVAVKKLVWR